ncbi:CxC2 domain-containing protein [Salix suchowensis]|nr:CxC2 domain-containing protein [Salix suchowensis]
MVRKRPRLSQTLGSFSFFVDEPENCDDISYTHISYEGDSTGLRHATHRIHLPPSPTHTRNRPEADDNVIWHDELTTDSSDPSEILPDPGNFGDLDVAYIEDLAQLELSDPKRRNRTAADEPLLTWLPFREQYLLQLLRREGRGRALISCPGCLTSAAFYRCTDCYDESLYCRTCIVDSHSRTPFHRIEHWTEEQFFTATSLKALGLRIQLGHDLGKTCLNPSKAKGDAFVILDTTGIHEVALDFCDCQTRQPATVQLLQRGLFPSTVTNPQTAATFHVLDTFQMLSMEGQVSAFEFYKAISRITDKTDLNPPRDRYPQFLRMSRQWRHLLQLKRSARGHQPDGAEGTKAGELAVLCPACPQPGMNLPAEIEEQSWLHSLFIGIDANFRLKRKNVSNDTLDPGLSRGWAYFVEDTAYQAHVASDETPVEKSSCVSHKAVNDADKRPAKGLLVNGVGTVECTRHDFKRPFIKSVDSKIPRIVASYDIACQWHINLWRRMDSMPTHLKYTGGASSVTTLVPKFHLPAHISACQAQFSFNYTPEVGRTDGRHRNGDGLSEPSSKPNKRDGTGIAPRTTGGPDGR